MAGCGGPALLRARQPHRLRRRSPSTTARAEPFAAEAVYFVLTDRFVNGDPANDQRDQGGENRTFDRPLARRPNGVATTSATSAATSRGLLDERRLHPRHGLHRGVDHADRRQPGRGVHRRRSASSEALLHRPRQDRLPRLLGRQLLPASTSTSNRRASTFADFTAAHARAAGLKVVLDIVGNHGSPSLHDAGRPAEVRRDLRPRRQARGRSPEPAAARSSTRANPLHRVLSTREPDLAQLSNFDDTNPARDGLPRRRLPAVDRPGRRARSASTRSATCRRRSGTRSRERIRERAPGLLHVRRSTSSTTRTRSRRTCARRTAA